MAGSEYSLAHTILYLRPQRETIEVLDIVDNEPYVKIVAPPPKPVDIPLGKPPDLFPTTHLSPYSNISHDYGGVSRESTPGPGLYTPSPKVLRLGFDSIEPPPPAFEVGLAPKSHVKVPYYSTRPKKNPLKAYFRIHYNFNSGALLITALDEIKVGDALLPKRHSLLLMAGATIHCGGEFEFKVEFPDLSNCAQEHEMNYQAYAAELGFPDAQYLASSQEELLPIGAEHRSVTILGQGTFGEVHKALHIRTAKAVAIKILNGRGRDEMKEVNIMSKLNHESIIKYERAFALPSGKICIVMELAVNDLETHLKARQNSKGKAHLSLECFQSINRQALSGLDYLHRQGVTHRDLKTTNILVTKWDTKTDTPTIKLADFGLAGIGSKHTTFCGTKGYVAPEVIQAHQSTETLKKQKDKGMETNSQNQLLVYTHAVDIWTLGKIFQELLQYVPSVRRGRRAPVIKEPALRLIRLMMQDNPGTRPTAAECLKHPWVAIVDSSDNVQAQKRDRSPTPSTSSPASGAGQPLRKVIRRVLEDSTEEGSTIMMMNSIWPDGLHYPNISGQVSHGAPTLSDVEMEDHFSFDEEQLSHDDSQPTQLTIQLREDGQLSLTTNGHNGASILNSLVTRDENIPLAILADNTCPRGAPSSMQDITRRLLAALQAEGYNNTTIAGSNASVGVIHDELSRLNISSMQLRQESEGSVLLRLEFDNEEWTSSFRNEVQPAVSIGLQLAGPVDRNSKADDVLNSRSHLQILFGQAPLPSFVDALWFNRQESDGALAQLSVPTITLNNSGITGQTLSVNQLGVTSIGNRSSLCSESSKGVTYPNHLEDVMASISF